MSTLELVQNERVSIMSVWRKLLTPHLGLLFVLLSFIAVVILLSQNAIRPLTVGLLNTAAVIVGILLTLRLTDGWLVPATRVVKPWLGLVFWLLIGSVSLSIWHLDITLLRWEIRGLEIGTAVLLKLLFTVVIPLLLLWVKGDSVTGMGLNLRSWPRNLGLALLLSGILADSLLPFRWAVIEDAGWPKAGLGVVVGFTYNLFQAGFPEEFFYRAYLQGHLAVVFRSRLTSLLLASLIFGLLHILGRLEQGIATAFAFSMLNETVRGLLYGVVWERTISLIVPTVLHAMVSSMLGLRFFVERVLG